jgi:hypothetical protein
VGRSRRWWIPVLVLALLAGWWWRKDTAVGEGAAGSGVAAGPEAADRAGPAPRAAATPERVLPGGYVGPDLASLSPAERAALRDAEVERSAAAPPPRTFKDIDGRQRAFRYPDPVAAESAERRRQSRREQLMLELEADPARFARTHRLSLKQVQWIVDGETDFPDRLLDPP